MCGKCIEGCYLAGWRNGVYSFEHMQEEPDFMGNDVKAAHGLVEAVCSLGSSLNELHALGLADSPMIAWAEWIYKKNDSHTQFEVTLDDDVLKYQRLVRHP